MRGNLLGLQQKGKPNDAGKSKPASVVNVRKKKIITLAPQKTQEGSEITIVFKKSTELGKHQENIRTILLCSNATPIRRHGGLGYMCSFCPQQFPEASLLKTHTLQNHGDPEKAAFTKDQTLPGFAVKLDITDLECTICNTPYAALDDLTTHLVSQHLKPFHTDIKSHIIPFKFDSDLPRCVFCCKQCNSFKLLIQHMNVHFRNHVCEVCGLGFVNKNIFHTHMYRHSTGVFKCSHCPKIFDNKVKCKDHERAIHVYSNRRNICAYCGERFNDYAKKNSHEVTIHGAKALVLKCVACNKTFDNQRKLTAHTKFHHLMDTGVSKTWISKKKTAQNSDLLDNI